MRIRSIVSATLASVGILVVGWQSGTHVTGSAGTAGGPAGGPAPAAGAATSGTGTSGSAGAGSAKASGGGAAGQAAGTFAGTAVQTRFGAVQVQITVSGSKLSEVTALQLTNYGGRSVQISNYAAPLLRSEVLQAQSANVQTISGATVTSSAYLTSLQSALDAAHL